MKQEVLKIKEKIAPVVEGLGYELADVKTSVQYGTDTVTVVIFKEGDMGLDDCEKVHNAVDALFDEINPFGDNSYNLEVSSMGLDWPLKPPTISAAAKGRNLKFPCSKNRRQQKITGILDSFDDDGITIKLTDIKTGKDLNKSLTLSKKEIAKASLAIRFE